MKEIFKIISFLLLFIAAPAWGQQVIVIDGKLSNGKEKRKEITQSYPLANTDKVSLKNKYGTIKIETWDKNEIKVEVTIKVNGKTAEKSQSILDGITIYHHKAEGVVQFRTDIQSGQLNGKGYYSQKMEIDYRVYMPVSNALHIQHDYGNVEMPNYEGPTDIHVHYGSLTGGGLRGSHNEVDIAYGGLTLTAINNGEVSVRYSGCDIDSINGVSDIDFAYCSDVNIGVNKNTGDVKLKNAYSGTVDVVVAESTSANFEIEVSYSEAKNKNAKINFQQTDRDQNESCCNFTKQYSARIGNGDSKIKIKSSYSGIKLK
jgi:hypothetical protein